jgi:hypothetical protein
MIAPRNRRERRAANACAKRGGPPRLITTPAREGKGRFSSRYAGWLAAGGMRAQRELEKRFAAGAEGARRATTLGELEASGVTLDELRASGVTLAELERRAAKQTEGENQ